jgi:hypothetical protein
VSFQGQCLNLRHFIKLSSFILEGYRVRAVSLVIVNEEVANNPYITFKANTRTKSSCHAKLNLWGKFLKHEKLDATYFDGMSSFNLLPKILKFDMNTASMANLNFF